MEITIQINGQAVLVEVSVEVYTYLDQADHKDENLAHEQRRHWDMRELDEYIIANECSRVHILTPEQWLIRKETLAEIMAVLNACTQQQRQRFLLYALDGISYAEIGRYCGCSKGAVQSSSITKLHHSPYHAAHVLHQLSQCGNEPQSVTVSNGTHQHYHDAKLLRSRHFCFRKNRNATAGGLMVQKEFTTFLLPLRVKT